MPQLLRCRDCSACRVQAVGASFHHAPLVWNQQAERDEHRYSVFCASMADVFEKHPQLAPEREKLWRLIAQTPHLNWLLLTKRPEHILSMVPWKEGVWPDNVWIGTSAGNQRRANERLPLLIQIPAVVRFVSYEPALEQVDFTPWLQKIDWLICGGESGARARPFHLDWARSAREQYGNFFLGVVPSRAKRGVSSHVIGSYL